MYHYLLQLLACISGIQALRRDDSYRKRIVGGTPCSPKTYPYIVTVLLEDRATHGNYYDYCGGSLLNSKWVLSAAHCYTEEASNNLEEYLIIAGISFLSKYSDSNIQRSTISRIVMKEFAYDTHYNDIALLNLEKSISKSNTVDYTTLPANNVFPTDLLEINPICTAMGWGRMIAMDPSERSILSNPLRMSPGRLLCVNLPLIRHNQCKKIYQKKDTDIIITNTQMCTLYPQGGKDACVGDSGGPLVCNRIQQGITSWGIGCAAKDYPGVFTRVDRYVGWIKRVCGKIKVRKLKVSKKLKEGRRT